MSLTNAIPVVNYLPLEQRVPDFQIRNLFEHIMTEGRIVRPIQGGEARMIVGAQCHFKMANGAPVTNLRDLSGLFRGSISENIGFLNGEQTLEGLVKYGLNPKWWDRWVTPEKCADFGLPPGDLGDASYGAVWTRFPKRAGNILNQIISFLKGDRRTFNQITAVIEQMKRAPHLRTHKISNWYAPEIIGPKGTRKVVVAPCHGDLHFFLYPDTKELVVHHVQRSGDLAVGVMFNIIQYTALGMMMAQILGYTFVELVYTFSDVHIYDVQYEAVRELISREPLPFGRMDVAPWITDIHDFRAEHFTLSEYSAHPKMNIPTPV